jgi:hypothetical protein
MTPVSLPRMHLPAAAQSRWSTTSVGDSADTQPMELSALGEHVSLCRASGSRYGGLLRGAQAVHCLVASRFVTTLAVVVMVIGTLLVVF